MYWHFIINFLNENPFKVEQIKANGKFQGEKKKSGFVDSGIVKTCDEFLKGLPI